MAGTWSFDVRMAYNYPRLRSVWGKVFSAFSLFSLALPSSDMSVEGPNTSRSPSRGLRQSFSDQMSDIRTKLVRALSTERRGPNNDGSSQYSRFGGESLPLDQTCPVVGCRRSPVNEVPLEINP